MTALAPDPWDVSIGDHGYKIDTSANAWRHESIPLLRPVYVTADRLGENDINPESNWRFSDVDWSHGAGQRRADETDSDTARFWQSQGVDVWTKWQVALLPDATVLSGAPNVESLSVFDNGTPYLYVATGTAIEFTSDLVTWHTLTGADGNTLPAWDGAFIYYADSSTGELARATAGATSGSVYNSTFHGAVSVVNGRVMAMYTPSGVETIANVVGPLAGDIVDLAAVPTGWVFPFFGPDGPGFVAGQNAIYYAIQSDNGALTQIYKITIADDGTTLNPPIAATPPIAGDARAIFSWDGLIFLGQTGGFRMCIPGSDGSLTVGAMVELPGGASIVRSFAGRDRFIYFGWENWGSGGTVSGLGRIDPTVVFDDGSPSYASDLMGTAGGQVLGVANRRGQMLFTTAGIVHAESATNLVASGFIDSGLISYGLPDDKAGRYLTVRTDASSAGDITPSIAVDGSNTFTGLDTVPAGTLTQRDAIGGTVGGFFEIRETLIRDASDATQGAVLTRHMLEADPVVISGFYYYVPVIIADVVLTDDGQERPMSPATELAYLEGLRGTGTVVPYTEPGNAYPATVEDITWQPTNITTRRDGVNGTFLLKLKSV